MKFRYTADVKTVLIIILVRAEVHLGLPASDRSSRKGCGLATRRNRLSNRFVEGSLVRQGRFRKGYAGRQLALPSATKLACVRFESDRINAECKCAIARGKYLIRAIYCVEGAFVPRISVRDLMTILLARILGMKSKKDRIEAYKWSKNRLAPSTKTRAVGGVD